MNEEKKSQLKKNVVTGASTAAGAVGGVALGAVFAPEAAAAEELELPEEEVRVHEIRHDAKPSQHTVHQPSNNGTQETASEQPATEPLNEPEPEPTVEPEPDPTVEPEPLEPEPIIEPEPNFEPDPEVEVVSYDRVTHDDGSQADVAVVSVDGDEFTVVDTDLDGEADLLAYDSNHNNVVDEGEIQPVDGMGIQMAPLQEAAGFNETFAQGELPDYVNDADVDIFMA